MERSPISADDLFALGVEAELATVIDAVAAGRNVAVTAPPFAGRSAVLAVVEAMAADSVRRPATAYTAGDTAAVRLYDDCHRLYHRQIGGFSELQAFLDELATTATSHVTTWNSYAWDYLSQATAVAESFETVVSIDRIDDEVLSTWLTKQTADYQFVADTELPPDRFDSRKITSFSALRDQLRLLTSEEEDEDPRQAGIHAVVRRAAGNPGVAKAIWLSITADTAHDGTVQTSTVGDYDVDVPELDYDSAYALSIVLANDSMPAAELSTTVDQQLDRTLRRFERYGLIDRTGSTVSITPHALKPVVEHLNGRRLLW